MLRALFVAGGALLASVGALVFIDGEPARSMASLFSPDRPIRGMDVYLHDHYVIFDPLLFLGNLVVFGAALFVLTRLSRRGRKQGAE